MSETNDRPATSRPPKPHRAKPVTAASLERAALHYLERFSSSTGNLRRVLMRRVRRAEVEGADCIEAAPALIDALIRKLEGMGVLDDRRYAEAKAASLHRRGGSRRRIAGKLAQQGLEADLIAAALEQLGEEAGGNSELAAACLFLRRRRLGAYRSPEKRDAAAEKDLASLARAGFSLAIARRVLACPDVAAVESLARGED